MSEFIFFRVDFVVVLVSSSGLLFFFLSFFGQVFPNFQKMCMVIAVGRTEGSRTSIGQWRFRTPGIGLSRPDKKEF